jgi:hypothetical protein
MHTYGVFSNYPLKVSQLLLAGGSVTVEHREELSIWPERLIHNNAANETLQFLT